MPAILALIVLVWVLWLFRWQYHVESGLRINPYTGRIEFLNGRHAREWQEP